MKEKNISIRRLGSDKTETLDLEKSLKTLLKETQYPKTTKL